MTSGQDKLLARLFLELCQTEHLARKHSRIEADRLGDPPPARALLTLFHSGPKMDRVLRVLHKHPHL